MDVSGLEAILYSTHAMLAAFTKTPEIQLTEGEAQSLAYSVSKVAEHYDLGANMAPEVLAWTSLLQTAAMIYGPRIFATRARRRLEAAQQTQGGGF